MERRSLLAILAAAPLAADTANGDPRLQKLYAMFIAPCCWRENLLTHHSPEADKLRAEISRRVAAGEPDLQIKQALLARYSQRILSVPDGARGQVLSWMPPAAAVAGLAGVVWTIRGLRKPPSPAPAGVLVDDWDWDAGPPPDNGVLLK